MWPGMVAWGSICLRNPAKTSLVPKLPEVPSSQPILALAQERSVAQRSDASDAEITLSAHTQSGLVQTGVALAEAVGIKESDRVEMAVPYHTGVVYPVGMLLSFYFICLIVIVVDLIVVWL